MEQLLIFFHFLVGPSWNQKERKSSKKKKKIWECIQQFRAGRQHIRPCKCNPHIQSRTSPSNGVSCRRSTAVVRVAVCLDCGREEEETCNNNNNMIDGRRLNPIRVKDPKEKVLSPFTHTHTERERKPKGTNHNLSTLSCVY